MKKLLSVSAFGLILLAGCGAEPTAVSYYGESAANEEGEITTVSYDKEGTDITNVVFDVILPEGEYSTTSKLELSNNGEYGMKDQTGKSWTEHVEELDAWVEANDAFPTLNEEGIDADGVTGATITLTAFEEAFNNATEA